MTRRSETAACDVQLPSIMERRWVIATLAVTLTVAARASASVVNASGLGAADAFEAMDAGAQKTTTTGQGLIDSGPTQLTAYRMPLDRSIEGPWDGEIAPISAPHVDEPIATIAESFEFDVAHSATTTWNRSADVPSLDGGANPLQLDADDFNLVSNETGVTPGGA